MREFRRIGRVFRPAPFETRQRLSVYSVLGLSILYASAYFLPATASGAYFLPTGGVNRLILVPTAMAVVVVGAVLSMGSAMASQRRLDSRVAVAGAIIVLTGLSLIALKGLAGAAGYDWEDRLPTGSDLLTAQRHFKIMSFLVVLAAISLARSALAQLTRILGGLGFAFALLAVVRLLAFQLSQQPQIPGLMALDPIRPETMPWIGPEGRGTRRVVWVLFDETDFGRLYGPSSPDRARVQNFDRLARMSVFATNANSPASATLYSIPALLTGTPISGDGIRIDKSGLLGLEKSNGKWVPFESADSLFGAVSAGGRSASILGFLHPYCKLFDVQQCASFHWPEMGRLDSALWANIPSGVASRLGRPDTWEDITQQSLRLLPDYLARDDALTFVHLNVPHPPAAYADKVLHLAPSTDPATEYAHNLFFADSILGDIIHQLERQTDRHEVLLVVSTDHWLRNMWYQAKVRDESKPIPFMVWKVGDTQGTVLSQPLSTVHTAAMIVDFLNGKLDTQAAIAKWWSDKPVYPTYIVPNT